MCQAIVKPANVLIEKNTLRMAWHANPDGAGMAFKRETGEVIVVKGYMRFKSFWKAYRKVEHLDVLIHFRYATQGLVHPDNCHPFLVGDNAAMVHNGHLEKFEPWQKSDTRSDSMIFANEFLAPAIKNAKCSPQEFISDNLVRSTVTQLIGSSKLAFLTPAGFTIYNETRGQWSQGVWYSAGVPTDNMYAYYNECGGTYLDQNRWDYMDEDPSVKSVDVAIAGRIRSVRDEECSMCPSKGKRLYQLYGDTVCEECWQVYAG